MSLKRTSKWKLLFEIGLVVGGILAALFAEKKMAKYSKGKKKR